MPSLHRCLRRPSLTWAVAALLVAAAPPALAAQPLVDGPAVLGPLSAESLFQSALNLPRPLVEFRASAPAFAGEAPLATSFFVGLNGYRGPVLSAVQLVEEEPAEEALATPEPGTWLLLLAALGGLAVAAGRRGVRESPFA